jgi:hypothetical protein
VTGLIYVVIIALWAAVLIPIWLRRHDQISEVRSTARFSSAMSRLGSPGQVRYAGDGLLTEQDMTDTQMLDRRPPAGRPSHGEARMTRPTVTRPVEGLDPDYERELARQAAATRRAVVLGTLTALLVVTLLLAVIGVLPRWAPALAAIPVVAFVVAAAMTASARTPASRRRPSARPARRERADEVAPSAPAAAAADDDWESWNAWDDDDSWEPVPATLPTYVNAPRASAVPRGIDRAHDGEWNGEAMVETAQSMRSRRSAPPLEPLDVDYAAATTEIPVVRDDFDGRRAVNE